LANIGPQNPYNVILNLLTTKQLRKNQKFYENCVALFYDLWYNTQSRDGGDDKIPPPLPWQAGVLHKVVPLFDK
jgi:hypothetical protein